MFLLSPINLELNIEDCIIMQLIDSFMTKG